MKQNTPFYRKIIFVAFLFFVCSCNNDATNEIVSDSLSTDSLLVDTVVAIVNEVSTDEKVENLVVAKDQSKLNPVQLQVQKLLVSCVDKDYEAAAKTIMYRGKDEIRMGNDHFIYSNPSEANTVKVTCDVIYSWLGSSESYEFISFNEEETEYGLVYNVEVLFTKEKIGIERHFFQLMETSKGFLLVNML